VLQRAARIPLASLGNLEKTLDVSKEVMSVLEWKKMEYRRGVLIIRLKDGRDNICTKRVDLMKIMRPYERKDVMQLHGIRLSK
jgi:hypothetical protein